MSAHSQGAHANAGPGGAIMCALLGYIHAAAGST
jgi:hypothetical protein